MLANLAIVAISTSLWTFGNRHVIRVMPRYQMAAFGTVMAVGTLCAMSLPFQFTPGVLLDLRYTFLAITGLYGGPLAAIGPFVAAIVWRVMDGGMGLWVGIPLIVMATASGLIAHRYIVGIPDGRAICIVALAVVFSGTAGFFVKIPVEQWVVVVPTVIAPFALLLFVSALVSGLAISQEMKRQEATNLNRIYKAIIEALPDCLNAKDADGRFIAANPATAKLMDAPTAASLVGKTDFDFYDRETATIFRADEVNVMHHGHSATIEQRFTSAKGADIWLSTLKTPLTDEKGRLVGMITHNREITDRKRLENELTFTQRNLSNALESMADGLAMFDAKGRHVFSNNRYAEMFPLTADIRVPGVCFRTILRTAIERGEELPFTGNIDDLIERAADAILRPGDREMRLADGRWIESRTRATEEGGSLVVFSDITKAKKTEEELRSLNERLEIIAHTDGLTGLLNRRSFDTTLARLISQQAPGRPGAGLLMIDVDKFKAYNDTYGHPAGDACLKAVAECIAVSMKAYPNSVVARYGGEEIAVIIPHCDADHATSVAHILCAQVRALEIVHIGSEKGIVTISLGTAAINPLVFCDAKTLLRSADEALYAAKAAGRDCVRSIHIASPIALNPSGKVGAI